MRSFYFSTFIAFCLFLPTASGCLSEGNSSAEIAGSENLIERFDTLEVLTFDYFIAGPDTLKLDLYRYSTELQPLVLFVHGGGFMGGSRNHSFIAQFCDSLAQQGFHVASMSYRLTMKGESFDCDQTIERKLYAFNQCATDIERASSFLKEKANSLSLDTSRFILAGSSAGAEGLLYYHFNRGNDDMAGIISMAGACTDTTMIHSEVPLLLLHGTCDPLVPFGSAIHHYCEENSAGALYLHGSHSIYEACNRHGIPCRMIAQCGGNHDMSNRAMTDFFAEVLRFCRSVAINEPTTGLRKIEGDHDCDYPSPLICDQSCHFFTPASTRIGR